MSTRRRKEKRTREKKKKKTREGWHMEQMVDSRQRAAHLSGVPVPAAACTVDRVAVVRQGHAGFAARLHTTSTATPSCVVPIQPARKGGPPQADGLSEEAASCEALHDAAGKAAAGAAAQRGDIRGAAGGSGGLGGGGGWALRGTRRSVSRPCAGVGDQPRVVEVHGAACLWLVAKP